MVWSLFDFVDFLTKKLLVQDEFGLNRLRLGFDFEDLEDSVAQAD